jgi:hypothetical protein
MMQSGQMHNSLKQKRMDFLGALQQLDAVNISGEVKMADDSDDGIRHHKKSK